MGKRVVAIGATGNLGIAVLSALRADADVASVDVIGDSTAANQLTSTIAGADAVIQLAPTGTAQVADAAIRAGIPQLVITSSVAVYSPRPEPDDVARDEELSAEDADRDGIPGSALSQRAVDRERLLDEIDARGSGLRIARLRTAAVLQHAAAAEVLDTVLGRRLPWRQMAALPPRRLPVPDGVRLQAIHAEDAARAYVRVALTGGVGAYNIAANDLLHGPDLSAVLATGRTRKLPWPLVRAAARTAYATRLTPADPGWVELLRRAPLMSTERARTELGWQPRHTARHALTELWRGIKENVADDGSAPTGKMT